MKQHLKNKLAICLCDIYTRETGLAATSREGKVTLYNEQNKKIVNKKPFSKEVQDVVVKYIQLYQSLNIKMKGETIQ